MKYKTLNNCTICNEKILKKNKLILNDLPITEIFCIKPNSKKNINFKQKIKFCNKCNHLSLAYQYNTSNFYNDAYLNYSHSFSNQYSNNIFLQFVKKHLHKKKK